jgi:hypothetical protein
MCKCEKCGFFPFHVSIGVRILERTLLGFYFVNNLLSLKLHPKMNWKALNGLTLQL